MIEPLDKLILDLGKMLVVKLDLRHNKTRNREIIACKYTLLANTGTMTPKDDNVSNINNTTVLHSYAWH
ncbi:hypothetical protein PanWU01x14_222010 [Parasponia andersonii]|uniref:Uncharacterized protein n=1 Tax=Parasponia andersonii TaxID=3476 RepID=A0A2P5BPD7_PARAD|nr:hypothetical protein PanWU01x14_222010 [Parasponia andersonii]